MSVVSTLRVERPQQAEEIAESGDLDLIVLAQWIAFNSLYGQWNEETREPVADIDCWRHFLQRMLQLDDRSVIVDTLDDPAHPRQVRQS